MKHPRHSNNNGNSKKSSNDVGKAIGQSQIEYLNLPQSSGSVQKKGMQIGGTSQRSFKSPRVQNPEYHQKVSQESQRLSFVQTNPIINGHQKSHDRGLSVGQASSRGRIMGAFEGPLVNPPRIPSDLRYQQNHRHPQTKRIDPVQKEISAQGNHYKQQLKTQEEFLFNYIKEFQDAQAESQAFKRLQQQKAQGPSQNISVQNYEAARRSYANRSDLHSNPRNHDGSEKPNESVNQQQQSYYAQTAIKKQKQISHQSDRYPFGVTMTIEDKKSGFKGHKHVVEGGKPFIASHQERQSYVINSSIPRHNLQEDSQQMTTLGMSSTAGPIQNHGNQMTMATNHEESILMSQQPILTLSNPTLENEIDLPQTVPATQIREVDYQTLSSMMEQEFASHAQQIQPPYLKLITEESSPGKSPLKLPGLSYKIQSPKIAQAELQIFEEKLKVSESIKEPELNIQDKIISEKSSKQEKEPSGIIVAAASIKNRDSSHNSTSQTQKIGISQDPIQQVQTLEGEGILSGREDTVRKSQQELIPQNTSFIKTPKAPTQKSYAEMKVDKIREAREAMAAQESDRYSENRSKLEGYSEQQSVRQKRRSALKMHFQSSKYNATSNKRYEDPEEDGLLYDIDQVRTDEMAQSFKNSKPILPSIEGGTFKSPNMRTATESQLREQQELKNLSKSITYSIKPNKNQLNEFHPQTTKFQSGKFMTHLTSPQATMGVGLKNTFKNTATSRQISEIQMVNQIVSDVERHQMSKIAQQKQDLFRASLGQGFFDKRSARQEEALWKTAARDSLKVKKSLGIKQTKYNSTQNKSQYQQMREGQNQDLAGFQGRTHTLLNPIKPQGSIRQTSQNGVEQINSNMTASRPLAIQDIRERFRDVDSQGILAQSSDFKKSFGITQKHDYGSNLKSSGIWDEGVSVGSNIHPAQYASTVQKSKNQVLKPIKHRESHHFDYDTESKQAAFGKNYSQLPRSIGSGAQPIDQQSKSQIKYALNNAKTAHTAQSFVNTPQRNNNQQMTSLTDNQRGYNESVERQQYLQNQRQNSKTSDYNKIKLGQTQKFFGQGDDFSMSQQDFTKAMNQSVTDQFEKINTIYKQPLIGHQQPTRQPPPLQLPKNIPINNTQALPTVRKIDQGSNSTRHKMSIQNQNCQSKAMNEFRRGESTTSASPTPRITLGQKIPAPPSPAPRKSIHRSHTRDEKDRLSPPLLNKGQIVEFDPEHLLHPLRFICQKKMLCSCNERPARQKSPPNKKSPREKKEPPSPPGKETNVQEKMENLENEESQAVAKMLKKVEWKNTPVYKQTFNLKLTEAESLKDTSIGLRRYKEMQKQKGKTMGQIALDLKDDKLRRMLLDQALKNVYLEPELSYLIKIVKNRNLNDAQMLIVYEKGLDTLEILMVKLGLDEPFQKVINTYESLKHLDTRITLLKVLTRCLVMYESLGKITVIFKLMKRRQEMEQRFLDYETNWQTGQKFLGTPEQRHLLHQQKLQALEQDVAQYCYHSCRLWVQINGFMIDHSMLNGFKFKFGGIDYQQLIREQVEITRAKFGHMFGIEKIPLMDEKGHLYYESEQQLVRVGGGFERQNVIEERSESPSPGRKTGNRPESKNSSPNHRSSGLASRRASHRQ